MKALFYAIVIGMLLMFGRAVYVRGDFWGVATYLSLALFVVGAALFFDAPATASDSEDRS